MEWKKEVLPREGPRRIQRAHASRRKQGERQRQESWKTMILHRIRASANQAQLGQDEYWMQAPS